MIKEKLFGATNIPILAKGLDAFAKRHRAISDNVANVETLGYKRRFVRFEDKLKKAVHKDGLMKTNQSHLGTGGLITKDGKRAVNRNRIRMDLIEPELRTDHEKSDVNDMNNVDIDMEMSAMAQNHLRFLFASKMAKGNFEGLITSIRGL